MMKQSKKEWGCAKGMVIKVNDEYHKCVSVNDHTATFCSVGDSPFGPLSGRWSFSLPPTGFGCYDFTAELDESAHEEKTPCKNISRAKYYMHEHVVVRQITDDGVRHPPSSDHKGMVSSITFGIGGEVFYAVTDCFGSTGLCPQDELLGMMDGVDPSKGLGFVGESDYKIGDSIVFAPTDDNMRMFDIDFNDVSGTVVGIRFTKSKVLYTLVEDESGKAFADVPEGNVNRELTMTRGDAK